MKIRLYNNFSKRNNSTKKPTGDYTTFQGDLKSPCDVTMPRISIRGSNNTVNLTGYSYAYITEFSRYYHVTEWTWENGFWICSMTVDVLATYKSEILSRSSFVIYSTSNFNDQIADIRLSQESEIKIATAVELLWNVSLTGVYSVGVISSDSGSGVNYYIMSPDDLGTLIERLSIEDGTEFKDQMEQLFAGASINGILNCTWLPFDISTQGVFVKIGNYRTGVYAGGIASAESYSCNIKIPWPYNDWRRSDKFMKMEIVLPFLGTINLNIADFKRSASLNIRCTVDFKTGTGTYIITGDQGGYYFTDVSVGANIPISGMSVDPYSALKEGVTAGASALGLNFGKAAESSFNMIEEMQMPSVTKVGSAGSDSNTKAFITANITNVRLNIYYHEFSDNPADMAAVYGRPLNAVVNLSRLTGFCQCVNYSADCGLENESVQINELMNGGVFIE